MGDNNDGSSRAAQGAQSEDEDQRGQGPLGFVGRFFGLNGADDTQGSDDTETAEAAFISRETQAMLFNVRKLRDIRVEDVAVPRADITAVPDSSTLDEVVGVFRESGFTRLPLYTDTLDSPLGMIHLKDVALGHGFYCEDETFDPNGLARPVLYVPPSMSISVLLQKMQNDRIHMALVIDEYGGVDGLVTIEDLVEQIVGEIADEHDVDEGDAWVEESPGVYLCLARAPLQEFEEVAGVDLLSDDLDEEVDTLGGLVFMLAGRVPIRGEVIPDTHGNEFEVVDADPRMLKRIRVRLNGRSVLDRAAE